MIISCFVCEKMCLNESIRIIGAETYSDYTGYSHTFKWKSLNHNENILRFIFIKKNNKI